MCNEFYRFLLFPFYSVCRFVPSSFISYGHCSCASVPSFQCAVGAPITTSHKYSASEGMLKVLRASFSAQMSLYTRSPLRVMATKPYRQPAFSVLTLLKPSVPARRRHNAPARGAGGYVGRRAERLRPLPLPGGGPAGERRGRGVYPPLLRQQHRPGGQLPLHVGGHRAITDKLTRHEQTIFGVCPI